MRCLEYISWSRILGGTSRDLNLAFPNPKFHALPTELTPLLYNGPEWNTYYPLHAKSISPDYAKSWKWYTFWDVDILYDVIPWSYIVQSYTTLEPSKLCLYSRALCTRDRIIFLIFLSIHSMDLVRYSCKGVSSIYCARLWFHCHEQKSKFSFVHIWEPVTTG